MKNLNRFVPVCLLLMAMVFMFSCSQDEALESLENTVDETVAKQLILPFGYEKKSEKEIQSYFENLDGEAFGQLYEHTRVGYYLEAIGMREKIESKMQEGELYSNFDLSEILSEPQLKALKLFTTDQHTAATRPCGNNWHYDGMRDVCYWEYIPVYGTNYGYYGCVYRYTCVYWRSCSNWPYRQYRYGCNA